MRMFGLHNCPYCGGAEIYASRPKTWRDEVCWLFLVRVVRCHSCMHRHFRPLLLPVPRWSAEKPSQPAVLDDLRERSA
jgi:hypothetical protein